MARGIQLGGADFVGDFQRGIQTRQRFDVGREQRAGEPARREIAGLQLQGARDEGRIKSVVNAAQQLKLIPTLEGKAQFLQQRNAQLQQAGIPTQDTERLLQRALSGDEAGVEAEIDKAIAFGRGAPKPFTLGPGQSRFDGGKEVASVEPLPAKRSAQGIQFDALIGGLTPEDQEKARRIELGLDPRAIGSSAITITEQGTALDVAETEEIIAGAKEQGKLKKKLTFLPDIRKAIKIAEAEGSARGEAITDLTRAKAAMPGLLSAVGQLKDLAPIATSTIGGKVFDFAVKETGFGSTKGANAKAKFIAIINNQVLPLLKPTFGAAFTEREGEALKASMSDPEASPSQKLEQLDAFIDQKFRTMEALETELGTGPSAGLSDVSDDDLLSF